MKLLIDTHVFIWWDSDPSRLAPHLLALCQDRSHTMILSVASIWEMSIKYQLGKLRLQRPLSEMPADQQRLNALEVLPVALGHVLALDALPMHHKDPFDRLLVAQAGVESATLVSVDPIMKRYPVALIH